MTKIDDAVSPVVDVAYKTAAGKTRVMPWNDLDPLAVADGSPYREFPWYLGQRNYSGMANILVRSSWPDCTAPKNPPSVTSASPLM